MASAEHAAQPRGAAQPGAGATPSVENVASTLPPWPYSAAHAGGMLELSVIDDGRGGFEPTGANGRGMHNMRARVLKLQSDAHGTRVLLRVSALEIRAAAIVQ